MNMTNSLKSNARRLAAGFSAGILGAVAYTVPTYAVPTLGNGSFETGAPIPGSFSTLVAGDNTSIANWAVTAGNIDYVRTYWVASDGQRSLDLNGVTAGAVSQTLATVAGHSYTVTFDMAGNPDGAAWSPVVKTMDVDAGGAPTSYSFDTTGHTDASMGWQAMSYAFTATGPSTTLTFKSTTGGAYPWFGPALDNVHISLDAPTSGDQCKNNGWKDYADPAFKNQGDCVSYVATQGKNPPAGVTF